MAINERKFLPGQIPTDIVRGNTKSLKIASNVSSISINTHNIQKNSGNSRTDETPFAKNDSFSNLENRPNPQSIDKKLLEAQIKEKNIQEMTFKEHARVNTKAQAVILYLMKNVFPEGLGFFERSKQLTPDPEQAQEIAKEDFERLTENPSKILQVALSVIPGKLLEMKKNAFESKDSSKFEHLERVDGILSSIFEVMQEVSGNGSHTALLNLIESLDQSQIKGDLHKLISEYHNSLTELGKQIHRANAQLLNRTRHPHSELLTGIITKIDDELRETLYTRPENLGAAFRDHLGGILGSLYDFLDTDWILPANCWEYSQVVKGNKSTSKTPFPVRRLAMEMRGYIGTLTEEQPGPMFVTTDVEAKTREPIAAKSKRTNRKKRRREEDYEEDYRYDD